MKTRKQLLVLGLLLLSGSVLAACPPVTNYNVERESNHGERCSYTSKKIILLDLNNHGQANCPAFLLTDPHYSMCTPSFNLKKQRCVCVINRH